MDNVLLALAVSVARGFAVSASATTKRPASVGHACSTAEDCCSRMCRKDTKKCSSSGPVWGG
ncbi:MAG: hypothetical protein Q8S33_11555 [Myxococcales bacterium]|nr:hypothetical protein [Myxococcales bacterium]